MTFGVRTFLYILIARKLKKTAVRPEAWYVRSTLREREAARNCGFVDKEESNPQRSIGTVR